MALFWNCVAGLTQSLELYGWEQWSWSHCATGSYWSSLYGCFAYGVTEAVQHGAVSTNSVEQCDWVLCPCSYWSYVAMCNALRVTEAEWLCPSSHWSGMAGHCFHAVSGAVWVGAMPRESLEECGWVLCQWSHRYVWLGAMPMESPEPCGSVLCLESCRSCSIRCCVQGVSGAVELGAVPM